MPPCEQASSSRRSGSTVCQYPIAVAPSLDTAPGQPDQPQCWPAHASEEGVCDPLLVASKIAVDVSGPRATSLGDTLTAQAGFIAAQPWAAGTRARVVVLDSFESTPSAPFSGAKPVPPAHAPYALDDEPMQWFTGADDGTPLVTCPPGDRLSDRTPWPPGCAIAAAATFSRSVHLTGMHNSSQIRAAHNTWLIYVRRRLMREAAVHLTNSRRLPAPDRLVTLVTGIANALAMRSQIHSDTVTRMMAVAQRYAAQLGEVHALNDHAGETQLRSYLGDIAAPEGEAWLVLARDLETVFMEPTVAPQKHDSLIAGVAFRALRHEFAHLQNRS